MLKAVIEVENMGTTIVYWFEFGHSSFTLKEKILSGKRLIFFKLPVSSAFCLRDSTVCFFGCKVSCRHGMTSIRVGSRIPAKMSVVSVELF